MGGSEKKVVAYLGPEASFTHQATRSRYPEQVHSLSAQPTIQDIFASVQNQEAIFGVVPFENSTNGSVVFTLDLFANKTSKYTDIQVIGEIYLPVQHCLLGHLPRKNNESNVQPGEAQVQQQPQPASAPGSTEPGLQAKVQEQIEGHIHQQVQNQVHEQVKEQLRDPITKPTEIEVHSEITSQTKVAAPQQVQDSPSTSGTTDSNSKPVALPTNQVEHSSVADSAAQFHSVSHIRTLYTHPQAWGQCNAFLSTNPSLRTSARQDCPSTSAAAALVASNPADPTRAAIASKLAAELYDLDILAEGIQDAKDGSNTTRFLIITHASTATQSTSQPSVSPPTTTPTRSPPRTKALVSFTVSSATTPGALASCLRVFADRGLSLTSINSRPSGAGPWQYVFFIEFLEREDDGGADAAKQADEGSGNGRAETERAVEDLRKLAREVRWLGRWEDALSHGSGKE